MKQIKIVVRRILLAMIIILVAGFLVLHYDSKEYTVQNEQEYLVRAQQLIIPF